MGSTGDLGADQSALRMENRSINGFQGLSSQIVVAIAAGLVEALRTDTVFLHGMDDFQLIVLSSLINAVETLFQGFFYFCSKLQDFRPDANLLIHGFCCHNGHSLSSLL
jgi:hypothetical protein